MGSAKPRQPQKEMVQVDRSESASPFWRSRSSLPKPESPSIEGNKVVGASYSHADMLKFGSLSLSSSSSRPRTPPSQARRSSNSTPTGGTPLRSSASKRYTQASNTGDEDWNASDGSEEEGSDFGYEDDEDEFGLPSISSMRRMAKRIPASQTGLQQRSVSLAMQSPAPPTNSGRPRANSADIAEERYQPSYPTSIKTEGKILRPQYKEILRDPANALHLINHVPLPAGATFKEADAHGAAITRINKFKRILQASTVSISELRDCAWSGIPEPLRAMSWQILLGYLPTSSERRVTTLERKRKEYLEGVRQAFERGSMRSKVDSPSQNKGRGLDEAIWHQISIDVPRTNPHLELYGYEATQRSLERILYLWAIRHPASGYVQGINDLVTPFWQVFLGSYITDPNIESGMDPGQLPRPVLDAVEADSFWCLTKLLDGIQDNYIIAQPGIQRQVSSLKDLTSRIDANLVQHLEREGVEFIQFSFRWMNCLLMRELSVKNTIRMWDTYMAQEQGFSEFHLYVCAAFLVKWSEQLLKMDFQDIMMFLQALPTRSWTDKDIELLLSEAFIWFSLFGGSSAHLKSGRGGSVVV